MKRQAIPVVICLTLALSAIGILMSCNSAQQELSSADSLAVTDSVNVLASNIARDISAKGPVAWLDYFENTSDFYMANNGQLVFHNFRSASIFIKGTLVKNISKITLKWSDLRVDPLTPKLASLGAVYHEDIVNSAGVIMPYDGYFTALAHLTNKGWKLKNVHWSQSMPPAK